MRFRALLLLIPFVFVIYCALSACVAHKEVLDAPDFAQACQVHTRASRERTKRCNGADADPALTMELAVEDCVAFYAMPGLLETPTTLTSCAAALETAACDEESARQACPPIVTGTLEPGVGCEAAIQCKSGFCRIDYVGGSFPKCGVCEARHRVGTACPVDSIYESCEEGTVCILEFVGESFVGTCTTLLTLGATCKPYEGPACPSGASCIDGTCQPRRAIGGVCSANLECLRGLVCSGNTCRGPSWKEPGAACVPGAGERCSLGSCTSPEVDGGPEAPSSCPRLLAPGAACDAEDFSTTCPAYYDCYAGRCSKAWGEPICR